MLAKLNDDKTGYAAMAREAARLEKQRVKQASYDPTVAKDHADCEQMLLKSAFQDHLLTEAVYLDYTRRLAEAKEMANLAGKNDDQKDKGKAAARQAVKAVVHDFIAAKAAAKNSKANVEKALTEIDADLAKLKAIAPADVRAAAEVEQA